MHAQPPSRLLRLPPGTARPQHTPSAPSFLPLLTPPPLRAPPAARRPQVHWKASSIPFVRRFERYLDFNFFEHQVGAKGEF